MIFKGFWGEIKKPIIGLSPMDGVTDRSFRYIVAKYGKPSVIMTEFTNVEGLARGAAVMMKAFEYDEIERPIVGQIYGVEVESFYKCTVMLCFLGFDGVDINMGCPANKVAKHGSGAGLIRRPELAKEIIRACKRGVRDFFNGISMEEAGVAEEIIDEVLRMNRKRGKSGGLIGDAVKKSSGSLEKSLTSGGAWGVAGRAKIPISIKTRMGYDNVVAEEWIKHLLEEMPANITMHGRTLKQMYLGQADWEVLAGAARICRNEGVNFLGNGDVKSMSDAREKCQQYYMDGVLVGRAVLGNPWFFEEREPSLDERFAVMLTHAKYYTEHSGKPFHALKKHLAWYCKGFEGAKDLRTLMMKAEGLADVEKALGRFA